MLLAGAEMITAYDPPTGRQLWTIDASTEAICGTVVWDGRRVHRQRRKPGQPEPGASAVTVRRQSCGKTA